MSRIIVKNLPTQITEDYITKHFSRSGNITDLKLIHKNGEFRRYGFIGFEKEEDAQSACAYFNNTYVKQAKVTVEVCQDLGTQKLPSWRERNTQKKQENSQEVEEDKSKKKKKKKKKDKKNKEEDEEGTGKNQLLDQYKEDSEFKLFLKSSEKGVQQKMEVEKKIQESASEDDEGIDIKQEEEELATDKIADKEEVSDLDYLKSLMTTSPKEGASIEGKAKTNKEKEWKEYYTIVIRAREMLKTKSNQYFTKQSVKAFLSPLKHKSLRIPRNFRLAAYVGFKTEKEMKQALQKDKSFLNGVRVQVHKYEKRDDSKSTTAKGTSPWSMAEERLKNEPVTESGRLFVRNLWYSVVEEDLRDLFESYGKLTEIDLPICNFTRKSKGFATVTFMFPEHAVRAMNDLDGSNFKGRILHILPGLPTKEEESKEGGSSYKDKKAKEQKATAGSWHNWNTLFMGTGAVVDIMAEKYGRSKQEILESEGKQSVAVNLALGETQVVDETKRFLEENGISLEAFSTTGVQRSSTVILVKNLPAKTTAQELFRVFKRYGELGRVVLPPSGVTGIVEYLDPGEAKKGFKNLAYSRFKSSPLYLEWAPLQVFKTVYTPTPKDDKKTEAEEKEDAAEEREDNKENAEMDAEVPDTLPDPEPETTIYVKNLNFSTTEDVLKEHFERIGQIHSALIAKRRGLSQGYGFVQFVRRRDAQKAVKELHESVLEDYNITLKFSEKTLTTQLKSARQMHDAGKQNSSKILVKNIPFQASHKEVRQLFATFGELKSVRLPKKPGSSEHRGFGFVEFVSREEAKKAFEALRLSTHLYDRRLVLEWAKEEETVEELRKKTAEQFLKSGRPNKRAKFEVDQKTDEDF